MIKSFFMLTVVLHGVFACYEDPTTCDERVFDRDSFVCVCDEYYCDVIGDVTLLPKGSFKRIVSSRDKYRFAIFDGLEEETTTGDIVINVDYNKELQTMLGFGGAFTDSTGISILSLPKGAQENFMRAYFSKEGIEYNLCRIPIGGTDFSTRPYSYDDDAIYDVDLEHFALTEEDFLYKIPLIHKAIYYSTRSILLFASPWSPPPWMKDNGKHNGKGGLIRDMWDPYANYLIRFVEEYEKKGIHLWGISTCNEPLSGFQDWYFNALAFSAEDMRDWIKGSFGPALERANRHNLKVIFYEHGRGRIPSYPATILRDEEANKYVDGVGIHWYSDSTIGPERLVELQNEFQDKFLLYTEACEGFDSKFEDKVQLGSWERAQNYSSNILEDINHYSTGWVDWNMALDIRGGPNWANNVVDAPVIVNEETGEFYKQPMFYAMGHFSKFVTPGSKRLLTTVNGAQPSHIQAASFHDLENNSFVFIVLNKGEKAEKISIETHSKSFINLIIDSKSLETILIRKME